MFATNALPQAKRRTALTWLAGLAASVSFSLPALADTWPTQAVRIVVPFPAGGGVDITARLIAETLRDIWNQPIIVDNRPGANSLISVDNVLNSTDEHTLLATNSVTFTLPYVSSRTDFKPLESLKPVAELIFEQLVLVTPANSGIESLDDLYARARAKPGELAYGSYAIGSIAHLLQDNLAREHNIRMNHIPYKGTAPLVPALMGGDVVVGVSNYGTVRGLVEDGRLRPIGVFGAQRSPFLPNAPTIAESGIAGFEANQWIGLFAPASTPDERVTKIALDVQKALQDPALVQALAARALNPGRKIKSDFGNTVRETAETQGGLSQAAGIRLD